MCGIAGLFYSDPSKAADPSTLHKMIAVMRHRGPDDEGVLVNGSLGLGHCRLSIIDLSDRGHQPMQSLDGRFVIVYNGEVYNYLEIRDELEARGYRFFSDSDTEVVLNAFGCWKEGCLEKFIGMFAFAIWDRQDRKLFVARDRLGVKPFYYSVDRGRFIFASEIKAILEVPGIHPHVNNEAIFEYLHFTHTLEDKTWFKGIRKLLPGHFGYVTEEGWVCSAYWDVSFDGCLSSPKTEHDLAEELRELMTGAVKLRLRSDVPVGAHLSGGLDSSSVVSVAARECQGLRTFSIGFNERSSDERRWSNWVKDYLKTEHSLRVVTHHDLPSDFEKITWLLDEPVMGGPVYSQFKLYEMVQAAGVKVVLGGQGGDEFFAGYIWHYLAHFEDRLKGLIKGDLLQLGGLLADLIGLKGRYRIGFLLNGMWRRMAYYQTHDLISKDFLELNGFKNGIPPSNGNGTNALGRRQYRDMKGFLPGLLHQEDRTSMGVSVESRLPLCDHRIVEFAAKLPGRLKIHRAETKYLQRKAVEPLLPREIVHRRDKKGFSTPLDEWFRGPLRPWVESILNAESVKKRGIFHWPWVNRLLEAHFKGRQPMANRIWSLLSVEMWFRRFVDSY